jgi:hypothetical protein
VTRRHLTEVILEDVCSHRITFNYEFRIDLSVCHVTCQGFSAPLQWR